MLASFAVSLKPLAPAPLSASLGKALHGLFYALVSQGDAALADQLHTGSSAKPFTVSPLRGRLGRAQGRYLALPDESYSVRYTTLNDQVFGALHAVLTGKYIDRKTIKLCEQEFAITDIAVEPRAGDSWARLTSAQEIWQNAPALREVTLRFASPTAFRQRGLNLLFPIPANVFHSFRERWNAFTPFPIDDGFLAWVEEKVAVSAHHLQTRAVRYADFELHGFTGWCRYAATDGDPLRLRQLNALADFALFCGAGAKTTQGMGQARRLDPISHP